jgi:dihydrolipoamide dehydrogenase
MEKTVDVVIIGAGTAGLNAMEEVRKVTEDFVLINGGPLGTTCARVGCMPSKVMIQIADDFHRRDVFATEGIGRGDALVFDMEKAMVRVRSLRDRFVNGIIEGLIAPLGDRFIEGYAEFVEPTRLKVGEKKIRADKIVIAAGSKPLIPGQWNHFRDRIVTTDRIFELGRLPANMAVVGLGAVGLELGQALGRMGIRVTGFDMLNRVGGLQDDEVNQTAVEIFSKEIPIHLGSAAEIEDDNGRLRVTSGDTSVLVDKVLLSMGRIPNVHGLHLERLGLDLNDKGLPAFDRNTFQVGDLPIFIAGDVNGDLPVLHEAAHEGTVAGYNAVHDPPVAFRRKTPVAIAFTDPNVCTVGVSWGEVEQNPPAVGTARFHGGREKIMLSEGGMIRIYADGGNGRLLGAEMAAPGGEHLAHLLAWSIQQELTVFDLLTMPFYHPAVEETLQGALEDLADQVEDGSKGPLLGFETIDNQ